MWLKVLSKFNFIKKEHITMLGRKTLWEFKFSSPPSNLSRKSLLGFATVLLARDNRVHLLLEK